MGASKCVSLYETSVRYGVFELSMELVHRVFQNISLPLKKARLTPTSRADSTALRSAPDQYSSWPLERKTLWFCSSAGFWSRSAWAT